MGMVKDSKASDGDNGLDSKRWWNIVKVAAEWNGRDGGKWEEDSGLRALKEQRSDGGIWSRSRWQNVGGSKSDHGDRQSKLVKVA